MEIKLYDFNKSFDDNFYDDTDKHIIIKVSKSDENICVTTPDVHSVCLSSTKRMGNMEQLKHLVWDYDTIFGTRYNVFKKYDTKFFDCQERVFFEALIIKYKRKGYKRFRWEKSKIGFELGIKRRKLDSIVKRFKDLGIIKSAECRMTKKAKNSRYSQGFHFTLDSKKIIELLPKIFSKFDYDRVEKDIKRYLSPDLV